MLRVVEKEWDGDGCVRNQWAEVLSAIGVLALVPNVHHRRSIQALVLEWPMLHVMWGLIIGVIPIKKMSRVKDGIFQVGVGGALVGVANEMLLGPVSQLRMVQRKISHL